MEALWGLAVIGALLALVFHASHRGSGLVESAWTAYFRGVRPDPWPVGVQEQYFEARWGSGPADAPSPTADQPGPSARLTELEPDVRPAVRAVRVGRASVRSATVAWSSPGDHGRPARRPYNPAR